ncbi:MAG: hypothetical protein M3Z84_01585 [Actinomycetota bacterium]|nr:hypothetical protein [Actinomycetota bacterium]
MSIQRAVSLAVVAVVLAVGCSNDKADKAAARSVPPTTTTTIAPTGSVSPSVTQTSPAGVDLAKGPPYERKSGPSGSGCTPPRAATLPAGWWAGKIKDVNGTAFSFDVVCWFSGQAAIKAGGEDDAGPVEDGYYVRNSDPTLYSEAFASGAAPATCVGDANQPFACAVGDVLALYGAGKPMGTIGGRQVTAFSTVWLHVTGETPDYLYMQFTP